MTRRNLRIGSSPADFSHAAYPPRFKQVDEIARELEGHYDVGPVAVSPRARLHREPPLLVRIMREQEQREPPSRADKIALALLLGTVAWVLVAWALTYVAPDWFAWALGAVS